MMPGYQNIEHFFKSTPFRILLFILLLVISLSLLLFLTPLKVYSMDITLAWDENTEPDLAGYRIFYHVEGQDYDYNNPAWEGMDTNCIISGLDNTLYYCFVARAFDTSDNESENSNEVCYYPPVNIAPVANAGADQTVSEAETVSLNGTGSYDPDGSITGYLWTQTAGTAVSLTNANAGQASFSAPFVGVSGESLIFQLEVTDNEGSSATDIVIVNVSNINQAPIANAGADQTVSEADTVSLNGTGSYDPDGSITTYLWTQTAGTAVSLINANSGPASFSAPFVGVSGETLTFQLEVTDNEGLKDTDSVIVNVTNKPGVNQAPVANAGKNQKAPEKEGVILDGTGSYDPDGIITTYFWTQIDGIPVEIIDETTPQPTFAAPKVGPFSQFLSFRLTVTDDVGIQGMDTCTVEVYRPFPNKPPDKPKIKKPKTKEVDYNLIATIETEPYTDPEDDTHQESQWQVSTQQDFSSLSLDANSVTELTEITTPHMVLEEETTYYVRVRFRDIYDASSEWSDSAEFMTEFIGSDLNNNGIPDDKEVLYETDLNADGNADMDQPELIKCIHLPDGNTTLGVCKISDSISMIKAVDTIDPSTIAESPETPGDLSFGLFSYKLLMDQPGATATVKLCFSEFISYATTFYKYDTINGWQDFTPYVTFNEDGLSITMEIVDGGFGDSDGVANGIIVDPGGIISFENGFYNTDNGRIDYGGCFLSVSGNDKVPSYNKSSSE